MNNTELTFSSLSELGLLPLLALRLLCVHRWLDLNGFFFLCGKYLQVSNINTPNYYRKEPKQAPEIRFCLTQVWCYALIECVCCVVICGKKSSQIHLYFGVMTRPEWKQNIWHGTHVTRKYFKYVTWYFSCFFP